MEGITDALGYPVFCPFEKLRGKAKPLERPLFQGYVFAGVDPYREDWQPILDVKGVVDLLMMDADTPGRVPAAWIDVMRHAEAVGEFDRTSVSPSMFEIGELIRVSEGPFAGHKAVIESFIAKLRSAKAKKRAKLLVQFMGRMSAIEMDVTALEKL